MRTLFALFLAFNLSATAQHQEYLDIGNVRALVNSNGLLFHDTATNRAGFEAPKGDSVHSIFSSAVWMGSVDYLPDSSLKSSISHELYGKQGDYQVGPVDIINQRRDASNKFQRLWKINKTAIDNHIANWNQPNYQTPTSILSWPGNGNANTAKILAPFADLDGDSIYEPTSGEYPLILGDQAIYVIANNFLKKQLDSIYTPIRDPNNPLIIIDSVFSGIYTPTQVEFHMMVYAYANGSSEISNTVFVKTTLFHRSNLSSLDHKKFRFSTFNDFDIGASNDDYMGTDSNRNMVYVYNSSNFDAGNAQMKGYGKNLGIQGLIHLNQGLNSSIELSDNSSIGRFHEKTHVSLYQSSRWPNGNPLRYGGNGFNYCIDTNRLSKYYFPGNPTLLNDTTQWTELNFCPKDNVNSNTPHDKKVIATVNFPTPFNHGTSIELDYAYVFAQDTGGVVASVAALQVAADTVQAFYDREKYVGISNAKIEQQLDFAVFPNPANHSISIATDLHNFRVEIYTLQGKLIQTAQNDKILDISKLAQGIYFVKLQGESTNGVRRLVVSH